MVTPTKNIYTTLRHNSERVNFIKLIDCSFKTKKCRRLNIKCFLASKFTEYLKQVRVNRVKGVIKNV